ncbi:MAG TPA: hypothetical protein VGN23_07490 [Verrucomicrobiae bacterium]|jgi:hypothetical protein
MPVQSLTLWECVNADAVNFTTAPQYAQPVTKTFAQWGIADNWDFKVGGLKDSATLQFPAGALSAASPFTFRSKVLIQIDDLNVFMGYVSEDVRSKSGTSDQSQLTLMGPWWYLQNLVYQFSLQVLTALDSSNNPTFTASYYTHFTLNLFPVYTFTPATPSSPSPSWIETIQLFQSQTMIEMVLDFAISQGAWLGYNLGNILNVAVHPKDVLNITCAEAIQYQIQDYDAVVWFDYSGTQPVFNCMQRKNLPTLTRSLVGPVPSPGVSRFNPLTNIEGFKLRERYDLKCPYVQIAYEQPVSVNGVQTIAQAWDIYPAPPGWTPGNFPPAPENSFKAIITTVPLRAINCTTHQKKIQTITIDMGDVNFWRTVFPEMDPNVNPNASNEFANLQVVDSHRQSALPNLIIQGGYCVQMGGQVARDNLIVRFSYQRMLDANRPGSTVSFHTKNRRGLVTNLNFPAGVYFVYSTYSSDGDVISNFDGMAQEIYEDLNPPDGLWEGTVPLLETTYSGQVVMGYALNLNNTLPQHAAMAALIQSISAKVRSGAIYYSLEVGPNKTISAQQIADRLRAARYTYIQVFNFGNLPQRSSQDILPTDEMTDAASETHPALSQHNVNSPTTDGSGDVNNTQMDAVNGFSFGVTDTNNNPVANWPSMSLDPADLTANDALNS